MIGWLLITVLVLFFIGSLVIFFAPQLGFSPTFVQQRWSLFLTQIGIVSAIIFPASFGEPFFSIALSIFALRAHYELCELHSVHLPIIPLWILRILLSMIPLMLGILASQEWALLFLLCHAIGILIITERTILDTKTRIGIRFGAILLSILLYAIDILAHQTNGFALVVWVYLLVETADTGAYLGGKRLGRTLIFPRLSPKKTKEGLLIGAISAYLLGILLNQTLYHFSWYWLLGAITVTFLAGVSGDLLISQLKRWQGRKDFARISVFHGGVLDIYDAFLFAAPCFLIYYQLT